MKMIEKGNFEEAYTVACKTLGALSSERVDRSNEGSMMSIFYMVDFVETLAPKLGKSGACKDDILVALKFLKSVPNKQRPSLEEREKQLIPYFEERLKQA
jgi:hypothetical protein